MTKNLRELHLVLVNSIILPRLEETLSIKEPTLEKIDCQPNQTVTNLSTAECFDIIEKEFLLRRFAVKMLGMLFRSRTGDGEKRVEFIQLLQSVATATPYGMRDWVHQKENDNAELSSLPQGLQLSQGFIVEEMNLRFEGKQILVDCIHFMPSLQYPFL